MSQSRAAAFLTVLRESQLLEPTQVDELAECPEVKANDLNGLAKVILQKGWLTRFQLTLVGQGKTKDLMLGAYRLLDRLGEGGMGQVFKAYHQPMGRTVALKVIRKEKLGSSQAVQRFFREVQAAAKLVHPNIVVAFDANQVNGTHYFAMEYVEGIDLAKLVKQNGPLPVPVACDYIRQAAMGLQHAHEQGMVHRDIKPHNLLVGQASDYSASRSGSSSQVGQKAVVKILDMGLARLSTTSADQGLTQDGAVIGTPEYIPPEQALDARGADIRSDLYSLGGVFFYLLTGRPPFQGGTLTEMLLRHQMEAAPDVRTLRAEVPADVAAIVARLLAKKPEERFQTPIELAQALEPICQGGSNPYVLPKKASNDNSVFGDLGGSVDSPSGATVAQPSLAGKTSFRKKQPEPAGMNKGLIAALAGAAVVAVALGIYLVIPKGEPQTQAQAPVAPPVPEKTTPAPVVPLPPPTPAVAVAEFTLKPLAPVTVKAGDSAMLPVQVERQGPTDKPIQVRLEGVPETAGQVFTIEPGKNDVQIKIAAPAGARAAQRTLTVVASLGSVERSTQVQLTVEARTEPPVVVTKPPMVEPPPPVAKKAEPPDAAKQAEALKLIKDLYKQDYAKTKPPEKRAFAAKLLGIAEESKDDLTARFVLLQESADLAAASGSGEGAAKAIDLMAEAFAIDKADLKIKAFTLASKSVNTLDQKAIAEAALAAANEAIEAEKFEPALQLIDLGEAAARKGQAFPLLTRLTERGKTLKEMQKENGAATAAAATLKDKPDDADANLVLGKYLALRKEEWDKGLPLLAKGTDARLKAAAEMDLKASQGTAMDQIGAGDAWYDLAAAADAGSKPVLQVRAHHWYELASDQLTGISKNRNDTRLAELKAVVSGRPAKATIWSAISNAVAEQQFRRMGLTGGHFVDPTFEEIPPKGALLIGFHHTAWNSRKPGLVQPIFRTEAGEVKGKVYGTAPGGEAIQVTKAKAGYAVGAIKLRGANSFDGFMPIFMKITATGLDPRDKYDGTPMGNPSGPETTFGGDGTFIVGVHGKVDNAGRMEAISPVSLIPKRKNAEADVPQSLDALDFSAGVTAEGFIPVRGKLSTKAEYTGPIEVTAVARLNNGDFRLFSYRGSIVIVNWTQKPDELRVHRPDGMGTIIGTTATAPVERQAAKTWFTVRWRLTADGCEVWCNGKEVFSEKRTNDLSARQKLEINFNGDLKSFVVKPIK